MSDVKHDGSACMSASTTTTGSSASCMVMASSPACYSNQLHADRGTDTLLVNSNQRLAQVADVEDAPAPISIVQVAQRRLQLPLRPCGVGLRRRHLYKLTRLP